MIGQGPWHEMAFMVVYFLLSVTRVTLHLFMFDVAKDEETKDQSNLGTEMQLKTRRKASEHFYTERTPSCRENEEKTPPDLSSSVSISDEKAD